jgi:hypothetical protein
VFAPTTEPVDAVAGALLLARSAAT